MAEVIQLDLGSIKLYSSENYPGSNKDAEAVGLSGSRNVEMRAMTIAAFRIAQNEDELSGKRMNGRLLSFLMAESISAIRHWTDVGRLKADGADLYLTREGIEECAATLNGNAGSYSTTNDKVLEWTNRMQSGDSIATRMREFDRRTWPNNSIHASFDETIKYANFSEISKTAPNNLGNSMSYELSDLIDPTPQAPNSAFSSTESPKNLSNTLNEFNRELQKEIIRDAAASEVTPEDTFFDHMTTRLESAGEIETSERASFDGIIGKKTIIVDGSGGDPRDSEGVLSLVICDLHKSESTETINKVDAKRIFSHLANFIIAAHEEEFRQSLTAGSPEAGLADTIFTTWGSVIKIKLILITNAIYSARTDAMPAGTIKDIPATYNIWDLSRFYRYDSSGQAREDLVIAFRDEYGGSIPALLASKPGDELESFLAVVPGLQLAEIYDKWGSRLLESNVRSFLQAKPKVNQGIRDTIKNEPGMFFSYNNGLSATADAIVCEQTPQGLKIVSAKNLQIVNGGQTTATIHAAKRVIPNTLSDVFVQMKLTVVPPVQSDEVVPKISEYANSQNKVSVADFFSNHPFHVRMEGYSRRVLAPAVDGSNRETKWFYERARGQYMVERAKRSEAEKKKFDSEFPKPQFFTKTDLAKIEFSFQGRPDTVSKGAQKNFGEFSKEIGALWTKNDARFDETWYRRLVAKLIVFKHLEKIIPRQSWYPGAYRANIVTYAIAKLVADAEAHSLVVDLDMIWRKQAVTDELEQTLLSAAQTCSTIIVQSVAGMKNVTEWAKKQACWENVRNQKIQYPPAFLLSLIEPEEARAVEKDGRRDAAMLSGIEAQTKVIETGGGFWGRLRAWGAKEGKFGSKEDSIIKACTFIPSRLPSEKQCIAALKILENARAEGYRDENDTPRVKISSLNRQY